MTWRACRARPNAWVIYFKNPVAPLNAAGSALALLGAYLYTRARSTQAKQAKEAEAAAGAKAA